jgi:formamidopyrimidine-DNA glycosylase
MPELPEVETFVRVLRPELVGREILSAELFWQRTLATPAPKQFAEQIAGQKISTVTRRAKYLDLKLSDDHLFIHLRMSGDLWLRDSAEKPGPHDRLHLQLSDGRSLVFNDTRKFGRVWLVTDPAQVVGGLGPEPFDPAFTAQTLYENLHQRRRQLKPLLLDQAFLAGLGNIYTDEALHLSGLHPLRISDTISLSESADLFRAIRTVLQSGIEHNGASIDWVYRGGNFQNYFRVYDRAGQPCQVCGAPIQRITIGQRGTHFCPNCQVKI